MDGGREERKRKFPLLFLGLELRIALVRKSGGGAFEFQSWRGRGHVLPVYFFLKFLNNFILQLEQASLSMNNNFIPFVRKKVIRLSRLHKLFVQLLLYQFFTNRIERTAFQRYYSTGRNRNGRAIRRSEYSNCRIKSLLPRTGGGDRNKILSMSSTKIPVDERGKNSFRS